MYINGLYRGNAPLDISLPHGRYTLQMVKGDGDSEIQSIPIVFEARDGKMAPSEQYLQAPLDKPVEKARKKFMVPLVGSGWLCR